MNFLRGLVAWLECVALGHLPRDVGGGLAICTRCGELHVEEEETDT